MDKIEQHLKLNSELANPLYKAPDSQQNLSAKADRILYYANEVSQPDS